MPGTFEGFPLLDLPLFRPRDLRLPWLVAFTTAAYRGGEWLGCEGEGEHQCQRLDFAAGNQRQRHGLERALAPLEVTWLALEHGSRVVTIGERPPTRPPVCDGALITRPGTAAAFTTADCLPIVIAARGKGPAAVAIHAGWRGLAAGIVEGAVERLTSGCAIAAADLGVWIGPAIAREDYEVGPEVKAALLARPAITEEQFTPIGAGRFLADLPGAATAILVSCGVPIEAIERHPGSTRHNPLFHSVRRDGAQAGRMATVVAIRDEVR